MRRSFLAVFCLLICSCGGGGGGGSTAFYGGIWDYVGVKLRDNCSSSTPNLASTVLTVNQNEKVVVVDSGAYVLTGAVDEANDGFMVTWDGQYGNCNVGIGYAFRDASDGEADVVVAIAAVCGSRQCVVGWGGSATRRSGRSMEMRSADDANIADSLPALAQHCAEAGSINGQKVDGDDPDANALVLDALK